VYLRLPVVSNLSVRSTRRSLQSLRSILLRCWDIRTCVIPRTFTRFGDRSFPVSSHRVWTICQFRSEPRTLLYVQPIQGGPKTDCFCGHI